MDSSKRGYSYLVTKAQDCVQTLMDQQYTPNEFLQVTKYVMPMYFMQCQAEETEDWPSDIHEKE